MKRYIHANTNEEYHYEIYQIKDVHDTAYGFMSWDFAKKHNFSIKDYEFIYEGEINGSSPDSALEKLWYIFNMEHPKDFRGHSLSMSDLVQLGNRYYYCDTFGWTDVTDYI